MKPFISRLTQNDSFSFFFFFNSNIGKVFCLTLISFQQFCLTLRPPPHPKSSIFSVSSVQRSSASLMNVFFLHKGSRRNEEHIFFCKADISLLLNQDLSTLYLGLSQNLHPYLRWAVQRQHAWVSVCDLCLSQLCL